MQFLFKKVLLCRTHVSELTWLNKTKSFLRNTKKTDRDCVNEKNTHKNITLKGVRMKIRGTFFFFRTTPLICQPLSFYVKNLKPPPLFGGKKKPKIPPFFYEGVGVSNIWLFWKGSTSKCQLNTGKSAIRKIIHLVKTLPL